MNTSGQRQTIVAVIAALIVVFLLHFYVFNSTSSRSTVYSVSTPATLPDQNFNLDALVSNVNKHCPFTVNKETRLDSVADEPGNKLLAYATFFNKAMNPSDTAMLKPLLTTSIEKFLVDIPQFDYYKKNNVTLIICCYDGNGSRVMNLTLTPAMFSE